MIRRTITALADIDRRVPIVGKLRMGIKTAKAMKCIDTWRMTSAHRDLIEQIAAHYGGTVKPWDEPKANPSHQFEVITEASEIRVLLVRDGLSTNYELWSGGGCQRRCDGVECEVAQMVGGDDYEMVKVPCQCRENNLAECDPHTRLTVVLPEFSFMGAWLYETKGWNAAQELPGFHALIHDMQESGRMVDAILSIESRERMTPRGKRNFKVPKLSVRNTPLEIAAGGASLGIGTGEAPVVERVAIGSGALSPQDDEPVDAEVLLDGQLEAEGLLAADARAHGLPEDRYVAAVRAACMDEGGDLNVDRMGDCSRKVRAGLIEPLGFTAAGKIQWLKKEPA